MRSKINFFLFFFLFKSLFGLYRSESFLLWQPNPTTKINFYTNLMNRLELTNQAYSTLPQFLPRVGISGTNYYSWVYGRTTSNWVSGFFIKFNSLSPISIERRIYVQLSKYEMYFPADFKWVELSNKKYIYFEFRDRGLDTDVFVRDDFSSYYSVSISEAPVGPKWDVKPLNVPELPIEILGYLKKEKPYAFIDKSGALEGFKDVANAHAIYYYFNQENKENQKKIRLVCQKYPAETIYFKAVKSEDQDYAMRYGDKYFDLDEVQSGWERDIYWNNGSINKILANDKYIVLNSFGNGSETWLYEKKEKTWSLISAPLTNYSREFLKSEKIISNKIRIESESSKVKVIDLAEKTLEYE